MRAHPPRALRLAAGIAATALVVLTGPAATAVPTPTPTPTPAVTSSASAKPVFRPSDPRLTAPAAVVAGIVHPDVWWTVASVSGRPMLFALDTSGRTRAAYTLTGMPAGNRPNAITIVKNGDGESGLFISDLRDGATGKFTLHRIAEPASLTDGPLTAESFKITYPDGPHAASTLIADPAESRLYVITTGRKAAAVFALPGVLGPGPNVPTRLRTLKFPVRGGQFAADGRVILKTTKDVRVLGGIRKPVGQVIRTKTRMTGDAFAVTSNGTWVLIAAPGPRPLFSSVTLPEPNDATRPSPTASAPVTQHATPVAFPTKSGLPGGPIGTGALVGLVLLVAFAGIFYLRGRRHG